MAPSYLQELLNKYTPTRNLRSSQKNLLECPVLGTRFYGEHTFSFGGPLLWNAVPLHLKEANSVNNFKSLLKTFRFQGILQLRVTISGAALFSSSLS